MRCVVTKAPEDAADDEGAAAKGRPKKSKALELSLLLKHVCSGLSADAVVEGAALPACIKSVEDHGYTLAFGIKVRARCVGCVGVCGVGVWVWVWGWGGLWGGCGGVLAVCGGV